MKTQECSLCFGTEKHFSGCPTIPGNNRTYFDAGQKMAREHDPHFLSENSLRKYDQSFVLGYQNEREKIQAKA